jgi:hypothetical protein
MADWYYGVGGNKLGPVPLGQLEQLVASGQVGPQTLVWHEGMPTWVPVHSLPFLNAPQRPRDDGGALNILIPIAPQSGFAIASGYLGLFGFFGITAPLAIIFGILALSDLKKHPEKRGMGRAITGIVLGSLCTIIFAMFLIGRHH